MQTGIQSDHVTEEDYLAAEETSDIRHEYLGGLVCAMAGETRLHNTIALNIATALRQHFKGGPCKVYMSDIRVNFDLRDDEYYYYPDIVVTCDKRDNDKRFVRHPKLVVEVLSPSTERIDKREKCFAYTSIECLEEYVLVSQTTAEVTVFRRANDWKAGKASGAKIAVPLKSLRLTLPLSVIYDGV